MAYTHDCSCYLLKKAMGLLYTNQLLHSLSPLKIHIMLLCHIAQSTFTHGRLRGQLRIVKYAVPKEICVTKGVSLPSNQIVDKPP